MGHDFGIGFRLKCRTIIGQFFAQFLKVFDDTVMDQRQAVGRVRMGVDLVRHTMGRPAGMANAHLALKRLVGQPFIQIDQLALGASAMQDPAVQCRDPRRIVTAVFQPL
jgi:hypothetical protein